MSQATDTTVEIATAQDSASVVGAGITVPHDPQAAAERFLQGSDQIADLKLWHLGELETQLLPIKPLLISLVLGKLYGCYSAFELELLLNTPVPAPAPVSAISPSSTASDSGDGDGDGNGNEDAHTVARLPLNQLVPAYPFFLNLQHWREIFVQLLSHCVFDDFSAFLAAFHAEILETFILLGSSKTTFLTQTRQIAIYPDVKNTDDPFEKQLLAIKMNHVGFMDITNRLTKKDKDGDLRDLHTSIKNIDCHNMMLVGGVKETQTETAQLIKSRGGYFYITIPEHLTSFFVAINNAFTRADEHALTKTQSASSEQIAQYHEDLTGLTATARAADELDLSHFPDGAAWQELLQGGSIIKLERTWKDQRAPKRGDAAHDFFGDRTYYLTNIPFTLSDIADIGLKFSLTDWPVENNLYWWANAPLDRDKSLDEQTTTLGANCVTFDRLIDAIFNQEQQRIKADATTSNEQNMSLGTIQRLINSSEIRSLAVLCRYILSQQNTNI